MNRNATVKLSYFDCRGRAQYLRYYLHSRGIDFEDHRVALGDDFSAWRAIRDDRAVTGPFQKLPVLNWDGLLISEMLVIQSFLHDALGDREQLSDAENLRHQMLSSSLYIDVMMPIGVLIWADFGIPGADIAALAKRTLERLRMHFGVLNTTLEEWRWLERSRERPVMLADCFLWEELAVAQHVLGEALKLAETPAVARFYDDFVARGSCERFLVEKPCQVTGHPAEAAALAKIRAALA
jgi:glutathione S-transferase